VELGSGAAHKTQALLDAVERRGSPCCYVPFDVSEEMLRRSSARLLERYPWLCVNAIVGDYDHHIGAIPRGERRLFAFLGGTIGNFDPAAAVAFLRRLGEELSPSDHLLLGTDLVKDESVLNAAYNDACGVTADFNKNILSVLNRELGADFDLSRFRHVAFYNPALCQIEMHLESLADQVVTVPEVGMRVAFSRGERMLTEISRKFSRDSVRALLSEAGLELCGWFESADGYFGLSLSRYARMSPRD
jgi:L-histidine N-alpha-methyltransferase